MHDEEEYDQSMKMIFISASHYDSSEADVFPPASSEEEQIDKTKKYQKEYYRKYYEEKHQQPYMCGICGKIFSTALISKDTQKKTKGHVVARNIV